MKISTRLFFGFAIVMIVSFLISAIGLERMIRLRDSGISMYEDRILAMQFVNNAARNYTYLRVHSHQVVIRSFYDDRQGAETARALFEESVVEFTYWLNQSRDIANTDELVRFHDAIFYIFENDYLPQVRSILSESINDIPDHFSRLRLNVAMASVSGTIDTMESLITGLVALNAALAEQINNHNMAITQNYIALQVVFFFISVVIASVVAFYIVKGIAGPIKESTKVLGRIATGDFSARVLGNYKGDMALIKDSLNHTCVQLAQYVEKVVQAQQTAHESELQKAKIEAASNAMFASIDYARIIQENLLPQNSDLDKIFSDFSVIWEPRDIVSGDIYWAKRFDRGSVLCIGDCTGHGTPGALLTMLVVSALENAVNESNAHDTAHAVWQVERRLVDIFSVHERDNDDLRDGCDLAVLFIATDGTLTISSGNISVFSCDGTSSTRYKGQRIFIGEGRIKSKGDIESFTIAAKPSNKYYIASDGLYDQPGGDDDTPFGYKRFEKIILENHNESQAVISQKIWSAFETYKGSEPRVDDFVLLTFKL